MAIIEITLIKFKAASAEAIAGGLKTHPQPSQVGTSRGKSTVAQT